MSSFGSGMAFEGLMGDIERMHERNVHIQSIESWRAAHRKYEVTSAKLAAERGALKAALERFDPNHPLLKDSALTGEIHAAAVVKLDRDDSNSWAPIETVGAEFPYAYTPPASPVPALNRKIQQMEEINVQNYVEKHALRQALARLDSEHPLIRPAPELNPLIRSLRQAGLMAFSISDSYEAVAEVGQKFKYPHDSGRPDMLSTEFYQGELAAHEKRVAFITDQRNIETMSKLRSQRTPT